MAVDKQEIGKLLGEYFSLLGKVSISNTGLVSINGNVALTKECDELPVRFDRVSGYFDCENKGLKTLVGVPQWVGDTFSCVNNQLENLKGAPQWVGGNFWCQDNQLESLKGMPLHIGHLFSFKYTVKLSLCEILTSQIKTVDIRSQPPRLESIIKKYLNTGYQGMLPFATELIRAGYGSNAWL
jgi:hypothetical protein